MPFFSTALFFRTSRIFILIPLLVLAAGKTRPWPSSFGCQMFHLNLKVVVPGIESKWDVSGRIFAANGKEWGPYSRRDIDCP